MAPTLTTPGRALAFDVGRKLIGVAVGQRDAGTARALTTVEARAGDFDWGAIDHLVAEWQPACFVVGLPLALDGGDQPMTTFARGFADAIARRHALPVHLVDERHSSQEASRRFARQRAAGAVRRKHAAVLDALAAQIILENWLAMPAMETPAP